MAPVRRDEPTYCAHRNAHRVHAPAVKQQPDAPARTKAHLYGGRRRSERFTREGVREVSVGQLSAKASLRHVRLVEAGVFEVLAYLLARMQQREGRQQPNSRLLQIAARNVGINVGRQCSYPARVSTNARKQKRAVTPKKSRVPWHICTRMAFDISG